MGVDKSWDLMLGCLSGLLCEAIRGLGLGKDVFLWILQERKQQGLLINHVWKASEAQIWVCRPRAAAAVMDPEAGSVLACFCSLVALRAHCSLDFGFFCEMPRCGDSSV